MRVYPLILTCLFLSFGSQADAADAPPVQQARVSSAPSEQDLEVIFAMAGQGDAGYQNYLGFLYATGQAVAKDEKAASGWFQKAADQGHPEALGNLATMYEKGLGVVRNPRMALSLHSQAAMAGYAISMKRLASLYETGFVGEERDPIKAEMWKTRYKETLKARTPALSDAAPPQAADKALATFQADKPLKLKLAVSLANTQLKAETASAPGDTQPHPVSPASSGKSSAAAMPRLSAESDIPPELADASSSAAKMVRGRYYYIQLNGQNTFEESVSLTQLLFKKELVHETRRVKIQNLDGKNFHISIGPFNDAREANLQIQKINQQAFLESSMVTLETYALASGDGDYQPFIQIKSQGSLDNAVKLTQTLVENELLAPKLFVEIAKFGSRDFLVRYGPFKGVMLADQGVLNLKKYLRVSPILVNRERLVPVE